MVSPAAALIPEVTPKPNASGSATTATVAPESKFGAISLWFTRLNRKFINRGRNQEENQWFLGQQHIYLNR